MKILKTIRDAQSEATKPPRVLVPTMGALHKAHGELIRVARQTAGKDGEVVVSIFVNPLQFEPGSDYERYPRPEKEDEEFCRTLGVDLLFRPASEQMYPKDGSTLVIEGKLSIGLEGRSRPGHFPGVCTVVAVFGEKDFQQLAIIRRMVGDLNYKIDIVAMPTVREEDGLACSSRNAYLNPEERRQAPVLRNGLLAAKDSGKKSAKEIIDLTRKIISEAPLARIDYIEMVDARTLQPIEFVKSNSLLAVAVFFGKTRLIDNIVLG